ncbi:MAG TPA: alpha/beta hydrolase [Anaerolineales bacterium]
MEIKENLLNYTSVGEGIPVILIHGIAASLYDWDGLTPSLASSGYRTIAVDLPGHGDSAKPDSPQLYHSQSVYTELEDWIDSLGLEQAPYLIGHSMGGYIGLKFGLRHPDSLRGLVLLDPFYSPSQLSSIMRLLNKRPGLGARALRAVPEWLIHVAMFLDPTNPGGFSSATRRRTVADLKRASPYIFHTTRTVRDLSPQLPALKAKTLVIWGDKDLTLRPASFLHLVHMLPHAAGRSIPGCGHQPHIAHPDLVASMVLEFLQEP